MTWHLFVLKDSKTISTNKDLINTIDHKKHTIESISDLIEASTDRVVSAVGQELLEGNALLLPEVYDWFFAILLISCHTSWKKLMYQNCLHQQIFSAI